MKKILANSAVFFHIQKDIKIDPRLPYEKIALSHNENKRNIAQVSLLLQKEYFIQ